MTKEFFQANLGSCKFQQRCTCKIKDSYECITLEEFYIFDEEDNTTPSKIVVKNEYFQLSVKNSTKSEVTFVKIDKCLFPEEKGKKKCDCILFNENAFFLVEIKNSKPDGRSSARKKAIGQLEATIEQLYLKEINVSELSAKAVICFKADNPYPIRTSQKSKQAVFQIKYNVHLLEGNLIEF
jgi:hypothetical protein